MDTACPYSPFPGPPLRGLPLEVGRKFPARKIKSAWVRSRPAPLGACVLRKSKLLRSRVCAWDSEPTLLVRFPP